MSFQDDDDDDVGSRSRTRSPLRIVTAIMERREPQPIRIPRPPMSPQRYALKFNGIVLLPTITTDSPELLSPSFDERKRFLTELSSNGLEDVRNAKVLVYWHPVANMSSTAGTRNQVHSNHPSWVARPAALPLGWLTTMYINQCIVSYGRWVLDEGNLLWLLLGICPTTDRYWAYAELSAEFILKGEDRQRCGFWGWITSAYIKDVFARPSTELRNKLTTKNCCYRSHAATTLRDLYETDEGW